MSFLVTLGCPLMSTHVLLLLLPTSLPLLAHLPVLLLFAGPVTGA